MPDPVNETRIVSPEKLSHAALKYNPHLWGDEELRAIFVVRKRELENLVQILKKTEALSVPQHILITGHRGMGKSTLLRRIALAVREDPELSSKWLPLNFPEEQYTVSTLAEFWRNVLDSLVDSIENQGATSAELAHLDRVIAELENLDEKKREEGALELIIRIVEEKKQAILLLVDSTDMLFASLSGKDLKKKKGEDADALWRLRNVLSHEKGIFWIGACYRALESEHPYQITFHDFFRLCDLRPLSLDEMKTAMLTLAETFGMDTNLKGKEARRAMKKLLSEKPERLKSMLTLSAGNPRTTVMLYELLAANGSMDVQEDLNGLLDTMTPLYKARIEKLSEQSRKLLAHLMELWHPQSANSLAKVSGIAVTTVSSQLTKLENEGFIEKTKIRGTKRTGFQVSERFFNVWYLMRYVSRRTRRSFAGFVEFMKLRFTTEELRIHAKMRAEEHAAGRHMDASGLEYSRALAKALPEDAPERSRLDWEIFSLARKTRKNLPFLFDLDAEEKNFSDADDYLKRFEALDEKLAACPHVKEGEKKKREWIQAVKSSLSLDLAEKESIANASQTLSSFQYDSLMGVFKEEREKWEKIFGGDNTALLCEATLKGDFFPELPDEKLALIQIEAAFGENPHAFARALCFLSERHPCEEVAKAFKKAISLGGMHALSWNIYGNLLQDNLKHFDEAEQAYKKAIEIDSNYAYPWNGLGNLLQYKLKRFDEAENAYKNAIEIDPNDAYPWNGLGNLFQYHLQRLDEAESAYKNAIEINPNYATPWNGLGNLLQVHLQRFDEAESAYKKAIEIDPNDAYPWNSLGCLFQYHLKRFGEAESAYKKAIEIDPNDAYPWNGLGNLFQYHLQRFDEAESAYKNAIEINPKSAASWDHLGDLLKNHFKRFDGAENAYKKAIKINPNFVNPWNGLGNLLYDYLNRFNEAEEAYKKAISLDANYPWPHANLARLFVKIQDEESAKSHYRQAIQLTSDPKWQGNETAMELRLQANLWLENMDQAMQALLELATLASTGNQYAFFCIKEQALECHDTGMGKKLARLMEESPYADFLKPFSLALRAAAAGNTEIFSNVAPEMATMAEEVYKEILASSGKES